MKKTLALAAVLLLPLSACVTSSITPVNEKSYVIGVESSANLGSAFVSRVQGSTYVVNGGFAPITGKSNDYLREELIYSGRTGPTLKVTYREFRGDLAAPAFFQELSYDLGESTTIRFRDFEIDVAEANNQQIRFTVLKP